MVQMCPDRQIISVYLDGELPSPWKEKLETHLEGCPACGARLNRYRGLSDALGEETDPSRVEEGKERVWRRLGAGEHSGVRRTFWFRSVSVPMPVAAAAAAVLVFAFILLINGRRAPTIQDTVAMGLDVQDIPAIDINGVLQYLGNEDTGDIVIIRLPESRSFTSLGEPALIKAADYSRRNSSR
jgi:anti-sigma factor RsiW